MRIAIAVLVWLALDASPRPEGAAAEAAVPAFGGHGLVSRAQDEKKHFDPAVHEATRTFAYGEFLVVPVRVHLLATRAQASRSATVNVLTKARHVSGAVASPSRCGP